MEEEVAAAAFCVSTIKNKVNGDTSRIEDEKNILSSITLRATAVIRVPYEVADCISQGTPLSSCFGLSGVDTEMALAVHNIVD